MIYEPDIIAVHTTCLSETIGDDVQQITNKAYEDGKVPEGKFIIHANTPSFVGSHVTGYANMTKSMVEFFAELTDNRLDQINIAVGWIEPSDMREIKKLAAQMDTSIVMFPDTSNVLDAPQTGTHVMYPKGGVTINQLKSTGASIMTLGLGPFAATDAAKILRSKCNVPYEILDLPIGLSATDRFIQVLSRASGKPVPESIAEDRGRLIDIITDMHPYLYGKKVALWGDPDHLIPLTEFLIELDMKPQYIISGTPGKKFEKRIHAILDGKVEGYKVKNGINADMFLMHQWIKNKPVDLLMGNTYGKYIARDEDIPFVRMGFPILDRIGHSYFPTVGYTGGMRILEMMIREFLDRKDRTSEEHCFELVM